MPSDQCCALHSSVTETLYCGSCGCITIWRILLSVLFDTQHTTLLESWYQISFSLVLSQVLCKEISHKVQSLVSRGSGYWQFFILSQKCMHWHIRVSAAFCDGGVNTLMHSALQVVLTTYFQKYKGTWTLKNTIRLKIIITLTMNYRN